ncbi:hypothetical protein [Roseofilum casamattae]|uniref:Uncharacterized protein n=1 Tax=Roseofilum casamattae BLCC-M143 TaxID=3022442 RepID=A0ABT7C1B7_9CYAN|nr:hypothetical protein [Roseofilum casamattae]MDJ1185253.1 hypothetical protein [Roseofilum casamattae BLCC-M143]
MKRRKIVILLGECLIPNLAGFLIDASLGFGISLLILLYHLWREY